jgi:hypothetical protein
MRKTLCAAAVVMASTVLAVPAAHAGPPCVTKREYHAVHHGMSLRRVHRIFDTRGHRSAFAQIRGRTIEIRSYRPCRRHSAVAVSYRNRRVSSKSAIWG